MIAAAPDLPSEPPDAVRRVAAGRSCVAVWVNELGGTTWRVGTGCYVKWAPRGVELALGREAERLRWAGRYAKVPSVIGFGATSEGDWLAVTALAGESAIAPRWIAQPSRAVRALGAGLRALHDALPVTECPFTWSAEERVAEARDLVARGTRGDPQAWNPDHAHLSSGEALARLAEPPDIDRVVVCQGDPCAPNTVLRDDGSVSGHVDLGRLGRADRWADLAVATWSTGWNYGPGWEDVLLDAYGVARDNDRMAYYRLLWDLGP